jgi:hypothetical protein
MPQRESDSSRKCHHYSDTLLVGGTPSRADGFAVGRRNPRRLTSLLSGSIDDDPANSFFVGDVILDELSIPLILADLKARRQFCNFPIALLDAGIHSVPFDLLLLGHRAFDVNLTCPHVDDDVIGMGQRLGSFDA